MTKEFKVPPPSKSDLFYLHCYYHVYKNLERQQNRENPIPKEPNPSKQQNSIPKQNRGKTERPLSTKLKNITTWLFFSYYSTSTLSFIRVAPHFLMLTSPNNLLQNWHPSFVLVITSVRTYNSTQNITYTYIDRYRCTPAIWQGSFWLWCQAPLLDPASSSRKRVFVEPVPMALVLVSFNLHSLLSLSLSFIIFIIYNFLYL